MCVMQILISCIDQEQNPSPTHQSWKTKNTTPSLFSSQPLSLKNLLPRAYFSMPEKKIWKNTMKNQWAGFLHVEVPGVTRVYKWRQNRCWHLVLWRWTETFLYLTFPLEEFLTSAFGTCDFAKIQRLPKSYKSLRFRSRERTRTFQIKQKWVPFCINPVGMCLHKWTNV